MKVVERLEDIPVFANEAEEADFWDTHTFSDVLWERLPEVPAEALPPVRERPDGRELTLFLTEDEFVGLLELARKHRKSYGRFLREMVLEWLEAEEVSAKG